MPIQCICEFVWNMLGGIDEIPLKVNIKINFIRLKNKNVFIHIFRNK